MKMFKGIGLLAMLAFAAYGLFVIVSGGQGLSGTNESGEPGESAPPFDMAGGESPSFDGAPSIGMPPEMQDVSPAWSPPDFSLESAVANSQPPAPTATQGSDPNVAEPYPGVPPGLSEPVPETQAMIASGGQVYAGSVDGVGSQGYLNPTADPNALPHQLGQTNLMGQTSLAHDTHSAHATDPAMSGAAATVQMASQTAGQSMPEMSLPPLPANMLQELPSGAMVRIGAEPLPELAANPDVVRPDFRTFLEQVCANLNQPDQSQVMPMYEVLCRWYGDPRLTLAEQQKLTQVLDQVTGTVIYSQTSFLERPHTVRQGESLDMIAQQYKVPWELLAKINGVVDPMRLVAGQQIKVLPGPFEAMIDMSEHQVVLCLSGGRHYAGRFPIGVGRDLDALHGSTYQVQGKERNPDFINGNGEIEWASDDPANPFAGYLIGLGEDVCLHATNTAEDIGQTGTPGDICLLPRDMDDLIDILSPDSLVRIQR